jgi:hypothetical protein
LLTQTFDALSTESVLANTTTGIFETLFVDKLAAFRVSPCHLTHAVNRVIQTPPTVCLPTTPSTSTCYDSLLFYAAIPLTFWTSTTPSLLSHIRLFVDSSHPYAINTDK